MTEQGGRDSNPRPPVLESVQAAFRERPRCRDPASEQGLLALAGSHYFALFVVLSRPHRGPGHPAPVKQQAASAPLLSFGRRLKWTNFQSSRSSASRSRTELPGSGSLDRGPGERIARLRSRSDRRRPARDHAVGSGRDSAGPREALGHSGRRLHRGQPPPPSKGCNPRRSKAFDCGLGIRAFSSQTSTPPSAESSNTPLEARRNSSPPPSSRTQVVRQL